MPHLYTKHQPGTPNTSNAERIRRYRQRRKAKGLECIQVWLDQDTIRELSAHIRPHGEYLSHAIARLLKEHAADFAK